MNYLLNPLSSYGLRPRFNTAGDGLSVTTYHYLLNPLSSYGLRPRFNTFPRRISI
jgi:hypothetical protein